MRGEDDGTVPFKRLSAASTLKADFRDVEIARLRDLADEQQKLIATLIEEKRELLEALKIAQRWQPGIMPLTSQAKSDWRAINAAVARAERRASLPPEAFL